MSMKIRQKLVLGFVGIALVIGVVGGVAIYEQNKLIENNAVNEIATMERQYLTLKERDTEILSSALEVFVRDQAFKDVYLEKDREKLYNYGQPLFQKLKNKYGITHFYFILPDGHCFVRLHNKDIYGDLITRFTFENARDTKKTASGIEFGKTAFALRVVMPYYHNNELIGYVEFGEEIDHFLEILKGDTNNEFAIIAGKKHLDREKWKSAKQAAGLRDNWDDLKEHIILSNTTKGKIEAATKWCFTEENLERVEEGEILLHHQIRLEDKTFVFGGFELIDAGGRYVGAVLSFIDTTYQAVIAQRTKAITLSMTIILLIVALGISFFISRSISIPITKLKDAAGEIGKGKLDTRIEIKSKDEIGDLAASFSQMAKDLKKTTTSIDNLNAANQQLQSEIAERKKAEQQVRQQSKFLNKTIESLTHPFYVINANDYTIRMANSAARQMGEISEKTTCYYLTHKRDEPCRGEHACPLEEVKKTKKPVMVEHIHYDKDGNEVNVEVYAYPIFDDKGNVSEIIEYSLDITERKQAEEQIEGSLKEKEVLLREIHHRVKNNMQVISSLMRLQARSIEDEKSVEIFRQCQNRVKSMALIHTKLYQSESLANIDFAEYVEELAQNLMNSYDIEPGKVALTIDVEKISLGVDLAVPCGLLVNELISNSLKHAFPKGAIGEVKIYMHPTENGQIELAVSDNGVGFPEELDFRKTNSLGMQLITSLTEGQLQGKIELNRSAGTEFKVTFDSLLNVKNELSKDKYSTESVCSTSA